MMTVLRAFIMLLLFQAQQPQQKREKDDHVEYFLLPFFAFDEVPTHQEDHERDQDIIKDGNDHRRFPLKNR
jgi:hypothetical protein